MVAKSQSEVAIRCEVVQFVCSVLPRFDVEIEPPLHVTPADQRIDFSIKAR